MKVTVLYDSVFGNTEQVAQAIGAALTSQADVDVLRVGDVQPGFWTGLDALIVGSPTRAFSPTPATKTRRIANEGDGLSAAAQDNTAAAAVGGAASGGA